VTVAKPLQGAVLSFFDEGDEPRTAIGSPPPRRGPGNRSRSVRRGPDERTVLARRAGAVAGAVAVVAIVVFGFKAYLASQNTQALKNYNSEVTTLVEGEQTGVAQPFFNLLNGAPGTGGGELTTLQNTIFQDYYTAKTDAATAAGWSVPGALAGAQQDLLLVLDLRAEAILKVSQQITGALKAGSFSAIRNIAGAMGMIAASDTIYEVRVQPLIEQALVNDGIQVAGAGSNFGGEVVVPSRFLPNQSWTIAGYVAGKILGATPPQLGGSLGTGSHGHQILSVMVAGTVLTPGTATINTIPFTSNIQYVVSFENDGSNDEFGVMTQLALQSATTGTQTTSTTTRETTPGQQVQATLGFQNAPPPNTTLQLTATIERVQGEQSVANNTLTFLVDFKK
jgi:hypothetical protein